MRPLALALTALLPVAAAAQDYCGLLEKRGPQVFGTKFQAPMQRDSGGACAANNADGGGRLTVGVVKIPGSAAYVAGKRKDIKANEGDTSADEPKLGAGAASIRREKGKQVEFLVPFPDRLLLVTHRQRDGLNDALVERTRAFVTELRDLR